MPRSVVCWVCPSRTRAPGCTAPSRSCERPAMTHPDSDHTATLERDLHAVDAALRDGAADHDDLFVRELQELGLLLQAEASEPDAEFAEALEKRVREGFPARPRSARALADEV